VLVALAAIGAALALRRRRTELAWTAALGPPVLAAVFWGALYARGYRASFSNLMPLPIFLADAIPAALLAVAVVAVLARLTRPGRLAPWVMFLGVSVPYAVLAFSVGADPTTVPPNVAGVLVFHLGLLVPAATLAALALTRPALYGRAKETSASMRDDGPAARLGHAPEGAATADHHG
jgi:hypothetical protein